jgi:hypothetical protein
MMFQLLCTCHHGGLPHVLLLSNSKIQYPKLVYSLWITTDYSKITLGNKICYYYLQLGHMPTYWMSTIWCYNKIKDLLVRRKGYHEQL